MAILKASVVNDNENHIIQIDSDGEAIRISMSEDKPNDVKSAFNKLIKRIKRGKFQIELERIGEDLFSQVANEYVTQLNKEILEVHGEMEQYGLVSPISASDS